MEVLKSFGNKKIGYIQFDTTLSFDNLQLPCQKSKGCYVILYAESGSNITSDFVEYRTERDTLFFSISDNSFRPAITAEVSWFISIPSFIVLPFTIRN